MHRRSRTLLATLLAVTLAITAVPMGAAQEAESASQQEQQGESPAQVPASPAEAEQAAVQLAEDASSTPAEGRDNLDASEEGLNDNNIDNDAGAGWQPTDDPESEITPGEMRSDSEEIPGGFTKEEADKAELQEAEEQAAENGIGVQATPTNCRTYWPSPFKVCGKIREKYDAMGGPASFLTWPRSDEMGVPDGQGRRNEFVNGFIYWHASTGAHPISTHFSTVYDRNGWEAGSLGYPTSDEFATPNGIGRKQEFQNGAVYGSPAGLAAVEGRIYDKYVSEGASDGALGFPTADEESASDGVGRFNRFSNGMIYWHPTHGAHPLQGDILDQWSVDGYETGPAGYPIDDARPSQDGWYQQPFENTDIIGDISSDPFDGGFVLPYISFPTDQAADSFFNHEATLAQAQGSTSDGPHVAPMASTVRYGPCVLNPNNIHMRTKSGDEPSVGFKPTTECKVDGKPKRIGGIHHDSKLTYKYYIWWKNAALDSDGKNNVSKFTSKNLKEVCDGDVGTTFWGSVQGTITYNGENYYATVMPPQDRFECRAHEE